MRQLVVAGALMMLPALAHADGIVVLAVTCAPTFAGPNVQGELRNDTNNMLDRVGVTGSFRDKSGQFVNKGNSRTDFNPLMSGQTSPFDFFGDKNPLITQVTIVVSVNDRIISSSGVQKADCAP
jgi:hypothetical protein